MNLGPLEVALLFLLFPVTLFLVVYAAVRAANRGRKP
jgi:hypothetical protein